MDELSKAIEDFRQHRIDLTFLENNSDKIGEQIYSIFEESLKYNFSANSNNSSNFVISN